MNMTENTEPQQTQYGRMARRDRFSDLQMKIQKSNPLIIDGGAHQGNTIAKFLSSYPDSLIYAFEPLPESVAFLKKRFSGHSGIKIFEKALGATNSRVAFNELRYSVSSSILCPGELLYQYHGSKMDILKTMEVEQIRLDSVPELKDTEIDILKLDLQGYELEALKGMTGIIKKIKTITLEVEFVPLYKNQALFSEIDFFLRQNNFQLLNLYELWTQKDGQLTAGDAIYLNNLYF